MGFGYPFRFRADRLLGGLFDDRSELRHLHTPHLCFQQIRPPVSGETQTKRAMDEEFHLSPGIGNCQSDTPQDGRGP